MEENKIKLKPVEDLFLLSLEDKTIYTKKNILYCLIYQLVHQKNLLIKKNKYKINITTSYILNEYEAHFLYLLEQKDFIQVNNFITDLAFYKTLIANNIFKEEIEMTKKFFFFNYPQIKLVKTKTYYEQQAYYKSNLENNKLLVFLCPNRKLHSKIQLIYNLIVRSIKQANQEQKEKKKNEITDIVYTGKD